MTARKVFPALVILALACGLAACAAGDPRFTPEAPAGFWVGLWHGAISMICLIVGLFKDGMRVYELQNSGAWYDFGFLLGVMCIYGGGAGSGAKMACKKKNAPGDPEWEEVGRKVEQKVMRKMKEWCETEQDADWKEIGEKAEAKLKRKIREWAEKE